MMDPKLLDMLVCPENHRPLRMADEGLVARLNRAIAAGAVCRRAGQAVTEPVEGGLVREDGHLLYPIRDGIPLMLVDEAILLEEIPDCC